MLHNISYNGDGHESHLYVSRKIAIERVILKMEHLQFREIASRWEKQQHFSP